MVFCFSNHVWLVDFRWQGGWELWKPGLPLELLGARIAARDRRSHAGPVYWHQLALFFSTERDVSPWDVARTGCCQGCRTGSVMARWPEGWGWVKTLLHIWLVVWNINFIFPYLGNNHPNWLIFFRGVETTNQNIIAKWCGITSHEPATFWYPSKKWLWPFLTV